ncbi:hypothetical protein QNI19_31330 [Cytophagaceae bacterium DM2B3-1]|uniref:SMI1/KNR4 family protein n=1 Tax=Xanthocytophaga flava TaxID=3048013 RepID=A0ABT7CUM9_9BACT|nr:hypothetical protein [Xanthocytophaga flavus]MDJ1497473.1 hypothetical protein [Xanthocytophaga flavus]
MLSLTEFQKNFGTLPVPDTLVQLLTFQDTIPEGAFYAEGFQLCLLQNEGIRSYSEDEEFLCSLIEFAQADWTGSTYALWINESTKSLEEMPIVVFGSEGGYHVVAQNLVELVRLLTLDTEPLVDWEKVSYYKDESDCISSSFAHEYQEWVLSTFQLNPIETTDEADDSIKQAQGLYQDAFHNWINKYIPE